MSLDRETLLSRFNDRYVQAFDTWEALYASVRVNDRILYHAALDVRPLTVEVTRKFKNGKLRIARGMYSFTADPSHLSRFKRYG